MSVPAFPLIVADDRHGVQIVDEDIGQRANVLGVLTRDPNGVEYDSAGTKWKKIVSSPDVRDTWMTRLLARTIYNPIVPVEVKWVSLGSYTIQELVHAIHEQIDKDDDILTQFVDADTIKAGIDAARSFQDLVVALNKYVFEVDEESLWKEQEAREGNC